MKTIFSGSKGFSLRMPFYAFTLLLLSSLLNYNCTETANAAPETATFIDVKADSATIMHVIATESAAFWEKDYEKWANTWAHTPYVKSTGWWADGGVVVRTGWENIGPRMKDKMANSPATNPQEPVRDNINIRIADNMAWVTFDQYGKDTGDKAFDMPGLSRETRILEKHNGQWKIVFVNWMLQGDTNTGDL